MSTHFETPYPIETLLQDLEALLVQLANPIVHLAGHSMGGYLVQLALCRLPGKIASATSISAGSMVRGHLMKLLPNAIQRLFMWAIAAIVR
ncbi:MAG: alpha/beta hydrolase [Leptolyngbya sp. SIO1D8]|nr:alpha/beta hydrolase [Leptolyngbya sp. SIO1D8]